MGTKRTHRVEWGERRVTSALSSLGLTARSSSSTAKVRVCVCVCVCVCVFLYASCE
jgi:hypothetical protein